MSEELILTNLIEYDEYARKVIPFLKPKYFMYQPNKVIFNYYLAYFTKYNKLPNKDTLSHVIFNSTKISESVLEDVADQLDKLNQESQPNLDWIIDTTEDFCQERAIYNAIQKSISIIDGEDSKLTKHAIPELLKDALAVSFDINLGHDYIEDAEERFEFYNLDHPRIPFDIEMFNKITNGGCPRKTLNILLGTTNVGKTLGLVHLSTAYLNMGYNVLYVTAEMAEESIANRVDANEFNINLNEVDKLQHDKFISNVTKIKNKTKGKLIIKEYPTSSAHVGHIRTFLQELSLKKNFKPDVIIVDYINIMASSRVNLSNTGSYFYIKAIAEELRGLAVETDCVLWSATQSNRGGANSTDVDLTDTAESFGLPATADFMVALIRTEELDGLGQLLIKQLKSRYGNKSYYEKFVIGSDINKMQWYDVEDNAQLEQPNSMNRDTSSKSNKLKDFKI
jgi:replicative DNA helicase